MDWEAKDKDIQKRIDWISATIRDTKFQLHQEHKELEKLLKEQEEHRAKKKLFWYKIIHGLYIRKTRIV